jgi:hypothetical protein
MAMKVVHVLEIVEVDQKHTEPCAATISALDGVVQVLVEQRPVGETGQAVMKRLVT